MAELNSAQPQLVDPENKPCINAQPQLQWYSPILMEAVDAVSKVLDDDNLLIEILLCVDLPTTLVCAALVCKRWLQHASDREFLCHFRKLHPPRLIGFYIQEGLMPTSPRFVLMLPAQHRERAAVVRRAKFSLESNDDSNLRTHIMDCRNGRVLTQRLDGTTRGLKVHVPLCPQIGMKNIPPLPIHEPHHDYHCGFSQILSNEGVNGLSYFHVSMASSYYGKSRVSVYMLKDGVWCMHTSVAANLPPPRMRINSVLVGSKIYMAAAMSDIIILDLKTSSFSVIQLPQGVDYGQEYGSSDTMLSRADDYSSVYLINAKGLQLRIWLHKGGTWLLVDTILMLDMFANLRMSGFSVEDYRSFLRLRQVGDNAEFVFLQMRQCIFYLDIKCRTLCEVHDITKYDGSSCHINPLMMIWPPTFPANKDNPARNAM
ncbi:hypothetical protein CFC21_085880 [Triticum aestivum]|uniref:F-box domain-containing protein n=2 Tax=Triticum aestivum TaxID=4565 RepID=A0A9R1IE08_WHEAT|nr:uncharacterized protein LOC123133127 [Triticum aestivum]KAF7081990.1 hypothetical protein CFC21_085880 [Triticum aestivum]